MSDTKLVRPSDPTDIIRSAVNAATGCGLTVSTVPHLGVHCTSTHAPRWEIEARVEVISPLGAVLLAEQPRIPDADRALADALGVNTIWVIGFDHAQAGEKKSEAYVRGQAAELYAQGYAAGEKFRTEMHRRQGVPLERSATETTRPLAVETPRQLIAGLLDSLTVSQVFEYAADSLRARREKLTGESADKIEVLETTAREMAELARDTGA